jgi:hypothetical protein
MLWVLDTQINVEDLGWAEGRSAHTYHWQYGRDLALKSLASWFWKEAMATDDILREGSHTEEELALDLADQVGIIALSHTSCVALPKLLNLSEPISSSTKWDQGASSSQRLRGGTGWYRAPEIGTGPPKSA